MRREHMKAMKTFVALLRGINLGARNKVPMPELKLEFESLGFEDVLTYIQSGNVVFRSSSGGAKQTAARIEQRIANVFGLDITVVLRTPAELKSIAGSNPFLSRETDLSKLHAVFLNGRPMAKAIAQLDPERSRPDEFSVRGREIYLHLPKGSGRSKLTLDHFERRLGIDATARNWKTVLKLLELAGPGGSR
jgi:uncharacterized protein (DUF1697 family)